MHFYHKQLDFRPLTYPKLKPTHFTANMHLYHLLISNLDFRPLNLPPNLNLSYPFYSEYKTQLTEACRKITILVRIIALKMFL